jgi:hypothetical protein
MIKHFSHYNQTNATRRFGQNQKSTNPTNSSHGPKDAAKGHMKTQLVELNEANL